MATANTWRTQRPRTSSGFGTTASQHSEEVRPKCYQGIIRCRPKNSEAVALRSGAHGGLMCPLEKGVRGIETSGSGYLQDQIRGGRKGRAERQGLGHDRTRRHDRRCDRASSDAGPKLAGRERHCGDGKPVGPDRPLEKGVGGIDICASEK